MLAVLVHTVNYNPLITDAARIVGELYIKYRSGKQNLVLLF